MTEEKHQTVFYSWQSDLPNSTNRGFILGALEHAAKTVRSDAAVGVDPVVDRDTAGVAGSPEIADVILQKIAQADIFVPDVSLVTSPDAKRPSPNPNVLLELGFAISRLGWDRVVMVMNTAFGKPALLPFDLRGHRVVTYNWRPGKPGTIKTDERRSLESTLKEAITAILLEQASIKDTEDGRSLASLHATASKFQLERLDLLATGHVPSDDKLVLASDKLVCVHVVPISAKTEQTTIEVGHLDSQLTSLAPLGSREFCRDSFNTDGLLRYAPDHGDSSSGFLQLFRNGVVETVDSTMAMRRAERPEGLPGSYFCKELVTFLEATCRLYEALQIQPPISALIAILGVKQLLIPAGIGGSAYYTKHFRQGRIVLPPIQLPDLKADVRPLLRKSLDVLWQAAGVKACSCYDANGKWSGG